VSPRWPTHLPTGVGGLLIRPVTAALLLAAALHLLWWWLLANAGGDIAAQDAWADFARRYPGSAYNLAWYGGMHPVSYSVLSPYVMAIFGVRSTMMVAGTVSAALLALLLVRSRAVQRPMWPALYGAVALVFNAVSGRATFGLGLMFGLAAVAVLFTWPAQWRTRDLRHRVPRASLVGGASGAGHPVEPGGRRLPGRRGSGPVAHRPTRGARTRSACRRSWSSRCRRGCSRSRVSSR
jgi:hypothetical protein